jgi:hypothetical protein
LKINLSNQRGPKNQKMWIKGEEHQGKCKSKRIEFLYQAIANLSCKELQSQMIAVQESFESNSLPDTPKEMRYVERMVQIWVEFAVETNDSLKKHKSSLLLLNRAPQVP